MSLEYISECYDVPAKKGGKVKYTDKNGNSHTGTIKKALNSNLFLEFEDESLTGCYHPTWNIQYEENLYFIYNGYSGNDCLFWAKDSAGYTTDVRKAELFTREQAFFQFKMRDGEDRPIPYRTVMDNMHTSFNIDHCSKESRNDIFSIWKKWEEEQKEAKQ